MPSGGACIIGASSQDFKSSRFCGLPAWPITRLDPTSNCYRSMKESISLNIFSGNVHESSSLLIRNLTATLNLVTLVLSILVPSFWYLNDFGPFSVPGSTKSQSPTRSKALNNLVLFLSCQGIVTKMIKVQKRVETYAFQLNNSQKSLEIKTSPYIQCYAAN